MSSPQSAKLGIGPIFALLMIAFAVGIWAVNCSRMGGSRSQDRRYGDIRAYVSVGMRGADVQRSLGKPDREESSEDASGYTNVWHYDSWTVILRDSHVTDIVRN